MTPGVTHWWDYLGDNLGFLLVIGGLPALCFVVRPARRFEPKIKGAETPTVVLPAVTTRPKSTEQVPPRGGSYGAAA